MALSRPVPRAVPKGGGSMAGIGRGRGREFKVVRNEGGENKGEEEGMEKEGERGSMAMTRGIVMTR